MIIDLENLNDKTILSHLAQVPGYKNSTEDEGENVSVASRLKASSVKSITGKFTLLPLATTWPEPLTKWLAAPGERVEVKKPFLRSYDQ